MTTDGILNRFCRAEIAEALEISGNQILQYEERGLLSDRAAHAQDIAYNSLDIARLRFILRCEAAGYKGDEIVDFIGTINKGASINEQLKASLVHAHQKFSYVNAQKRKADILEQVNLQADADLLKNYIEEMKGILADPKSSPIMTPGPIRHFQTEPDLKAKTAFEAAPSKTPGADPGARWTAKTDSKPEPEYASRLKLGLERSNRPAAIPKPKAEPAQVPPPVQPPTNMPKRSAPQKNRKKFIDSSSASDSYGHRITDSSSEMFIDYSGRKKSSPSAWKQTLVTFLLLCLLSFAGYIYYVLKYQSPPSIADISESAKTSDILSNEQDIQKEEDLSVDQEEDLDKKTGKETGSAKIPPAAAQKTFDVEKVPPQTKSDPKTTPESAPRTTMEAQGFPGKKIAETGQTNPPPKPKPDTTVAPAIIPSAKPGTYADKEEEKSEIPSSESQSAGSSLSGTAMKDLDDLLANKPQASQPPSESYEIAERPLVAVYDFKIFYQNVRKILIAKFKIARIRPQRNIIQGRLFVVFKPRQSSQNAKYFSVPDVRIVDGIPTEPFKGIEFSFSESTKVQSVRTIYVHDPSQFDLATVFVFSNAGELVLRKEFTVDITEY